MCDVIYGRSQSFGVELTRNDCNLFGCHEWFSEIGRRTHTTCSHIRLVCDGRKEDGRVGRMDGDEHQQRLSFVLDRCNICSRLEQ